MYEQFEYIFLLLQGEIYVISHQIKSNHIVLRKNEVNTYGAPVFAPEHSATVLAAKMCSNSKEHSTYFRFLLFLH